MKINLKEPYSLPNDISYIKTNTGAYITRESKFLKFIRVSDAGLSKTSWNWYCWKGYEVPLDIKITPALRKAIEAL